MTNVHCLKSVLLKYEKSLKNTKNTKNVLFLNTKNAFFQIRKMFSF